MWPCVGRGLEALQSSQTLSDILEHFLKVQWNLCFNLEKSRELYSFVSGTLVEMKCDGCVLTLVVS